MQMRLFALWHPLPHHNGLFVPFTQDIGRQTVKPPLRFIPITPPMIRKRKRDKPNSLDAVLPDECRQLRIEHFRRSLVPARQQIHLVDNQQLGHFHRRLSLTAYAVVTDRQGRAGGGRGGGGAPPPPPPPPPAPSPSPVPQPSDRRTGEQHGSLSDSARFTSLL